MTIGFGGGILLRGRGGVGAGVGAGAGAGVGETRCACQLAGHTRLKRKPGQGIVGLQTEGHRRRPGVVEGGGRGGARWGRTGKYQS